ncbi:hypothetical protein MESS4_830217 [Mesorhizobium sp. STM 4661]|nr:hypothetical protein MESS4_830217 [Mesorhizobium sp. STM 4661]
MSSAGRIAKSQQDCRNTAQYVELFEVLMSRRRYDDREQPKCRGLTGLAKIDNRLPDRRSLGGDG